MRSTQPPPAGLRRFAPLFVAIFAPQAILLAGLLAVSRPSVEPAAAPPPTAAYSADTSKAHKVASVTATAKARVRPSQRQY